MPVCITESGEKKEEIEPLVLPAIMNQPGCSLAGRAWAGGKSG